MANETAATQAGQRHPPPTSQLSGVVLARSNFATSTFTIKSQAAVSALTATYADRIIARNPQMAVDDALTRLVDRLPYSDGSARRRFIAGTLIVAGVAIPNWSSISGFTGLSFSDVFRTPTLVIMCGLLIYLAGTIVEMVGTLFLVPTAAVVLRPWSRLKPVADDTDLSAHLTDTGRLTWNALPERIRMGIEHRASSRTDLAVQFVPRLFSSHENARWCRKMLSRAMDVGATTTALIGVVASISISSAVGLFDRGAAVAYWVDLADAQDHFAYVENLPPASQRFSKLLVPTRDIRPTIEYFSDRSRGLSLGYLPLEDVRTLRAHLQSVVLKISELERTTVLEPEEADAKLVFRMALDAVVAWEASTAAVHGRRQHRTRVIVALVVMLPTLLLLYIGYFLSLRNAFINSIEARAIELTMPQSTHVGTDRDKPLTIVK